jgi:WXG100 family type VII secretion target
MADGYQTGAPELVKAAQDMVTTNEQLQDRGRQLAQGVDSIQSAWSGAAAVAFTNLMTQFSQDFNNMNTSLFNIAEQVSGAAADYSRQEEEASSDISAIMSTLDNG